MSEHTTPQSDNLALCGTKMSVEIRSRDDQSGLADRYYLRSERVGVPCLWNHCAIRTSANLGAHKRRAGDRSKAWAKLWPPALRLHQKMLWGGESIASFDGAISAVA